MGIKEIIKYYIDERNPLVIVRRSKMRKALKNKSPTFFCPNCIGGILFHDLGIKFHSPMVNLMMKQKDFVKFLLDWENYLSKDLTFFDKYGYSFPCAYLGDITIHFTHYSNEKVALEKWKSRLQRIDKENLFVFLQERDGLTRDDILSLNELRVRGLVVFTSKEYPDIPYTLKIPENDLESGVVGNVLKKNWLTGQRKYETYFDFVKWFNVANYDHAESIKMCRKC